MDLFLQTAINGLLIGGVFAAFSLGFQLAFGVLHVVDFAVGGWVMLGGYAGYWGSTLLGVDPFLLLPATFALFAATGYLLGPLVYRVRATRYARPALMTLAFTFGLFLVMRGGALTFWGFDTRAVSTVASGENIRIGPVVVPLLRLIAFLFAAALALGLFAVLYRTRLGLAIRATAQSREYAGLMGVDVKRLSALVYALYTGLTGVAGVLMAAIYSVTPETGLRYTLFAFFVAVLAGLGSVGGVLAAALFLGVLEAMVAVYVGSSYSHLVVFGTLYLVLLLSPQGILRRGAIAES
ncbi:MAG TPA: branched-chain amino acid ABC transporter permease [Thermodesulfobacteriota bacterium]